MAIAVEQEWKGATLDQYDQINAKMDAASVSKWPLSHWVAKTETGIRVVDVWDSREDFQKFADEQILPLSKAVGVPTTPKFTFYEAHNYTPKDSG